MKRRHIALGAVAAITAGTFLTGCVDAEADLTLDSEDEVTGTVRVSAPVGSEIDPTNWRPPSHLSEIMRTEDSLEDGRNVMTVKLYDVPFDDLARTVAEASARHVEVELEPTNDGNNAMTGYADFNEGPDTRMQVTMNFPGPVTNSNGEINGDSASWVVEGGEARTIFANAPRRPSGTRMFTRWSMLFLGAGLISALLVFLWARDDRGRPVQPPRRRSRHRRR
ncbi:hypothetical protein KRX51_09955 [Corynebacterium sp. TAE3-ERU12]|uniref:LppM family (lipo)protein n=1 Tax=Corynebacterium sp. TAE3-ERU12 TaxID=2849491 RepID=UPI001C44C1C4|nr:hypothetical protein [Corynebacterium sp. TAE3-ERU12]MBV7296234.1 hypothetical protein [Corynebacterium sp. TAE3-ERU12]